MPRITTIRSLQKQLKAKQGRLKKLTARRAALAKQLAKFPQRCMRSDRRSAYDQWSLDLPQALVHETRLGIEVVESGETGEGAKQFAAGAGRHGSFEDFE